jgi:hypothetical protein
MLLQLRNISPLITATEIAEGGYVTDGSEDRL